jgi:hypothetical protein
MIKINVFLKIAMVLINTQIIKVQTVYFLNLNIFCYTTLLDILKWYHT